MGSWTPVRTTRFFRLGLQGTWGFQCDRPKARPPTFGGYQVQLQVGEATFEIRDESETIRWHDTVCFFDFPDSDDETFLLGHSGFLDYFTATFDGKAGHLTLVPNEDLPAA